MAPQLATVDVALNAFFVFWRDENNQAEIERSRPRREAAVFRELKRKYMTSKY